MTEKELNQLHWINKEIGVLKRQRDELDLGSYCKGQIITDMPVARGTSDKVGDRAMAMQEINELYEIKLKELYVVRMRIERYIDTIEDGRERLIIRLKCINNMEWEDIGKEVGYERTTVSKIYRNHFKDKRYRESYDKNELLDRCGYWNVCSDHACGCSSTSKVSQGYDFKTYDSMSKSKCKE